MLNVPSALPYTFHRWFCAILNFCRLVRVCVRLGNVAALRQVVPGNQVGCQEAPGVGGYLKLSPHVDLRHENSVQVSFSAGSVLLDHMFPTHFLACRSGLDGVARVPRHGSISCSS